MKGGESVGYGSRITEAIQRRLEEDVYLAGNPATDTRGLVSFYWFYNNVNQTYEKRPAIFVRDEIPLDPANMNPASWVTKRPGEADLTIYRYIYSPGPLADTSFSLASSKQKKARDITQDLYCFAREDGWNTSSEGAMCEEMAERIFQLFDGKLLSIEPFGEDKHPYNTGLLREEHLTTWRNILIKCSGPMDVPQERKNPFDPSIRGMIVTLNITVLET